MLACPACGEMDHLTGNAVDDGIAVECGSCGLSWTRDTAPVCNRCGDGDMFPAVAAIVEKGRGTQLSVVGSRVVHLCERCDADVIRYYLDTRPNPLMPDRLPNASGEVG